MKTTLTLILVSITTFIFGQTQNPPVPMVDSKVNYTEKVTIDSSKKDLLYGKAKMWFVNTFKSSKDVIQLDDKDNGIIIGKAVIIKNDKSTSEQSVIETWKFTVKIQVKDGKYKVEIYDIDYVFEMPNNAIGFSTLNENLNEFYSNTKNYKNDGTVNDHGLVLAKKTNENFNALLASIKKAMTAKSNSDW